ncbi:hypothetical protein EJB05_14019, partial [Eragrostis curvula]
MAPPPPPLLDELIEEVLLRFPPDEPAHLVQAALVCKRWCRLVSEPRFRRRFREFHRSPPMLGFLCNRGVLDLLEDDVARFVPTTSFCLPQADRRHWRALDARHGRVLIRRGYGILPGDEDALVVWDPITGEEQELPMAPRYSLSWTAAILCAHTGACDHLDCHRGPFLVVFLGSDHNEAFNYVYSSNDDVWSEPISFSSQQSLGCVDSMPSVLIGNTLYFMFNSSKKILKYDLKMHEISLIPFPPASSKWLCVGITTMEDGGLGFAKVHDSKLYIWSREVIPEVNGGWVQSRIIELKTLLPDDALLFSFDVVGFADCIGAIFLKGKNGVVFKIDLKTYKVRKLCVGRNIYSIVAYMSFYTPALGAACMNEGPSTGASNYLLSLQYAESSSLVWQTNGSATEYGVRRNAVLVGEALLCRPDLRTEVLRVPACRPQITHTSLSSDTRIADHPLGSEEQDKFQALLLTQQHTEIVSIQVLGLKLVLGVREHDLNKLVQVDPDRDAPPSRLGGTLSQATTLAILKLSASFSGVSKVTNETLFAVHSLFLAICGA